MKFSAHMMFELVQSGVCYVCVENVGIPERLLEGDSAKLDCPVSGADAHHVIWILPDGQKIDKDNQNDRFSLLGKTLYINNAELASKGTYHCIVTHNPSGVIRSGDITLSKFVVILSQILLKV